MPSELASKILPKPSSPSKKSSAAASEGTVCKNKSSFSDFLLMGAVIVAAALLVLVIVRIRRNESKVKMLEHEIEIQRIQLDDTAGLAKESLNHVWNLRRSVQQQQHQQAAAAVAANRAAQGPSLEEMMAAMAGAQTVIVDWPPSATEAAAPTSTVRLEEIVEPEEPVEKQDKPQIKTEEQKQKTSA
jgi:hypothetical protein